MSLAATLEANAMRPASSLPTIKCSNCGDDIEISAMGEHTCSTAPASSRAPASPNPNNAFTIRQMNASETKPAQPSPLQFSASETKPAQPSPLQFNSNETKPAQPSPLQFDSAAPQLRPRAPTLGSTQLSIPKPGRPVLPRINSEAANQPFLGPLPNTPLSPASSIRSGSSGSAKFPPKRSMTSPMPRLWDNRPPSPELSANLDCAFPPFPTPSLAKRKASNASQSSTRSGSRPDLSSRDGRSPLVGPGENGMNFFNGPRTASRERGPRRPSNEDKSPRELNPSSNRPSPQSTPLTPLEEFPLPRSPLGLDFSLPPQSASPQESPVMEPSAQEAPRLQGQRTAPERPSRPDESASSVQPRGPSLMARKLSQKKVPPERPARPDEGIPTSLLNPMSLQTFTARGPPSPSLPPPPPVPLQSLARSRTLPMPSLAGDEMTTAPPLIKMPTEPTLPFRVGPSSAPETEASKQEGQDDESRVDPRMRDAPPVPRSVQLHRSGSLHKSSESGTSTASSVLSLSNMSLGNSNTTAGTSPVGSASGSLHSFMPFTTRIEKDLDEESMHVPALNVRIPQKSAAPVSEPTKDAAVSRFAASPLTAEVVRPSEELDSDDEPERSAPLSPGDVAWSLESPMDPALRNGILGDQILDTPREQSPVDQLSIESKSDMLAPASPRLERLSNAVYDPKRPFSINPSPEPELREDPPKEEAPSRSRSRSSVDSFKGFNFGSAFATTQDKLDGPSTSRNEPDVPALEPPGSMSVSRQSPEAQTPELFESPSSSRKVSETPMFDFSDSTSSSRKGSEAVPFEQHDSAASNRKPSDNGPLTASPPTTNQFPAAPPAPLNIPKAPPIPTIDVRPALMRRGTMGVKAACRGCHKQIEGKSVKAADGRLTGRWHKACFVCATCKSPFETADFYVINNQPYCEQHYHEKNDSVCHGCQRGIEGQFLETRSGPGGSQVRKYHRRCFTCVDCRMVLSDDYFEIAGRIHCERHALAAMRSQTRRPQPPGGVPLPPRVSSGLRAETLPKAEKQRTRVMQT